MTIAPATLTAADQAIQPIRSVLGSLPIGRWETHRRMSAAHTRNGYCFPDKSRLGIVER
jgi:hypothetical protein